VNDDLGAARLNRRSLLQWAALGIAAPSALAACGSSGSSSSAGAGSSASGSGFGSIAVQLSWIKNIEFAGEYFATSKGYYTAAGFSSVNLIAGGSAGTSAESAVASGKAFCGLSSPTVTAPAILQGAPLKIVGTTYQKNPFCILSIAKNPIAAPKDMKGKKIGVQQGTNDVIFKALLKANGMTTSDVTIVPVQYDPTVVTTGEVDGFMAYITNEPILIKAKGFDVTTFLMADYGLPLVAETLTVLQDSIDKDRKKVKAFLLAEIKGWKDAVASPSTSADLAVNTFGKGNGLAVAEQLAEATAQNGLIVSSDTKTNGIFTMSDALIAENIDVLGKVGTTIKASQLFDLSLLAEVYQENPSLKA
jgi:ABC-type nitrate/sulfonate/bicarbonate transport system substrate-binding protein